MPTRNAVLTPQQLLDAWYTYQVVEQGRRKKTFRADRDTVIDFWTHAGLPHPKDWKPGDRHPARVTAEHYRAWQERAPAPAWGRGNAHRADALERATKACYARRVIKVYRWWYEHGLIDRNPLGCVRAPKMPDGPPRHLTRNQITTLIRSAETDTNTRRGLRDQAVLWLMCGAGLRRAEVASARAEDCILDAGEESIRIIGKGQDGGKTREVPLHPHVADVLRQLLTDPVTGTRRIRGPLIPNYLWPGSSIAARTIYRIIAERAERAGVHVTPHMLRHSFATALADEGVEQRKLADLLGHVDTRTTDRYTKGARRRLREAVNRLPFVASHPDRHRVAERPPQPPPALTPPRREPGAGVRCTGASRTRRRRSPGRRR